MSAPQTLRVGILSASQTIEKTFFPTLTSFSSLFAINIIYHVDDGVAQYLQEKFNIPERTTSTKTVLAHPNVDLIFNFLPFEFHEYYTVEALKAGKHVTVETPYSMSIRSLPRMRRAIEQGTTEARKPAVFVSCARRYARCYTNMFLNELRTMGRILYARCRNINGPLEVHSIPTVAPAPPESASWINGQSGIIQAMGQAYSREPTQYSQLQTMLSDAFHVDDINTARTEMMRFLGTTGCHDLSLVREALGIPDAVLNFSHTDPFYNTVFHYNNKGSPFVLLWEAGVDSVPRCDSHLTVYGENKTISLQWDSPCIGGETEGGFGFRFVIEEREENGVVDNDYGVGTPHVEREEVVSSVAEAYAQELRGMYSYFVEGEQAGAKTSSEDTLSDLKMMNMIIHYYDRQRGALRTPLGARVL